VRQMILFVYVGVGVGSEKCAVLSLYFYWVVFYVAVAKHGIKKCNMLISDL
jgi:hypothetical protein